MATTEPRARQWAVLAVSALLAAGCAAAAPPAAPSAGPVSGGTLVYAVAREPDCLDPHVSPADITGEIQRNAFDSLVAQRPDGGFAPWLARSWEVAPDGRAYTFHLREDVRFVDGERFDAEAVRANFEHIAAPETKSQYAVSLLGPYAGTDVLDAGTVRVRFHQPYVPFLQAASTSYLGFYSPRALREHGDELCAGGPHAVGSGPFREVSAVKGQGVEFVRNDAYRWAPATAAHQGPAHLERLSVRVLPEDAVRTGALGSGQVDVAAALPPTEIAFVAQDPALAVLKHAAPGQPYTYFFNTARQPFADPRARQAVRAAIDLDGIVAGVYFGQYDRAHSPLSPPTFGYDPGTETRRNYDPALANRLLDELGYTGRDAQGYRTRDGQRFTVVHPWSANLVRDQQDLVSQAVHQELRKVGIDLVLRPVDSGTYLTERNAGRYDLIGFSWARADPDLLSTIYASGSQFADGGANGSRIHDPEIDALLAEGRGAVDPGRRAQAYHRVQQRILDETYALPVHTSTQAYGYRATVHGLALDANSWTTFYDTWVEPA